LRKIVRANVLLVPVCALVCIAPAIADTTPSAKLIIEKSVEANHRDFEAAPRFSYHERDRVDNGTKTWEVTMIEGSPYQRLIEVNGEPLSKEQAAEEEQKMKQEIANRKAESNSARHNRIASYQKDRKRDNEMMNQLTVAFDFKLVGKNKVNSRDVYVLKATPKPGYRPPNMETQVLTGMQGELWIDTKTYQWVKVTAKVIHPVSIEGFLAEVEPGTQFELEKMPVTDDIWLAKHFSMKSHAKILHLFNHSTSDDETYSNYKEIQPAK
jgi:hypothetical protein